jgi:hypothetical protein
MPCRSQRQVISKLLVFDDERVFSVPLKQPVFAKSLHIGDKPRAGGPILEQAISVSLDSPPHNLDCQPNRDECNRY